MSGKTRVALFALVVVALVAVAGARIVKGQRTAYPGRVPSSEQAPALPRLLDLGSVGCIACQQMEPILDDLKTELAGKVDVEFIDINKTEGAADEYGIQVIPTQIFFDKDGKELFRHVGVYPKADVLAKMKELGMIEG